MLTHARALLTGAFVVSALTLGTTAFVGGYVQGHRQAIVADAREELGAEVLSGGATRTLTGVATFAERAVRDAIAQRETELASTDGFIP
jgi:hypothetical protein